MLDRLSGFIMVYSGRIGLALEKRDLALKDGEITPSGWDMSFFTAATVA